MVYESTFNEYSEQKEFFTLGDLTCQIQAYVAHRVYNGSTPATVGVLVPWPWYANSLVDLDTEADIS